MIRLLQECIKYVENICINHTYELTFGTGIVLLYLVGPGYMLYAIGLWIIATALDILIGWVKAFFVFKNADSAVLWKSLIKRGVVACLGGLITFFIGGILAFATIVDSSLGDIAKWIALVPIGYWHLFTAQEISSLVEHLEDMRPDNRFTGGFKKIKNSVKARIDEKLDIKFKEFAAYIHTKCSPKFSKLHLNREDITR